jgi:cytoskeletal protein RodZ
MATETSKSKTPGEMVKEAREAKGLTVADVAAMTRIPKPMIHNLEGDRYDEYSAEVFARGHLRNYAREVDLEPEEVLQVYDQHTGDAGSEDSVDADADASSKARQMKERVEQADIAGALRSLRPSMMVAAGLVVLALVLVISMFTGGSATAKNPEGFSDSAENQQQWKFEKEVEESTWSLEKAKDE